MQKGPPGPVGASAGVLLLANATWIKSNMLVQKRSNARLGPIRGKRHGCGKKIFSPLVTEGSSIEKEPHVNRNYEWAHAAKWRRNCRLMQSTALMHVQVFYGYRRPEPTHIEQRKVLDDIAYGQDMGVIFFLCLAPSPIQARCLL